MTRSGMGTRLMITTALLAPLMACGPFGMSSLPPGEEIIEYGTPTAFLTCSVPAGAARQDTLIRPGGPAVTLRADQTELSLEDDPVYAERRIELRQEAGQTFSVLIDGEISRIPPPGLKKPAKLAFDVRRCTAEELAAAPAWYVWRLNPVPGRSQKLRTHANSQNMWAVIDSTSKFMIAN